MTRGATKTLSVLLVLFALAAGIWIWTDGQLPDPPAPELNPPLHSAETAPSAKAPDSLQEVRTTVDAPPPNVETDAAPRLLVYPAEREFVALEGLVVDGQERPQAGVSVQLEPSRGAFHPWLEIGEDRKTPAATMSGRDGRFHFARLAAGPYEVNATGLNGLSARAQIAAVGGDVAPIVLRLAAPATPEELTVVVLDDAKVPGAGARVSLHVVSSARNILDESHVADFTAVCDEQGRALIARIPPCCLIIDAIATDGRKGSTLLTDEARAYADGRVQVIVRAGAGIEGRLTGVTMERTAGSKMRALQLLLPEQAYYSTFGRAFSAPVSDAAFRFTDLPAGVYVLALESPNGLRLMLEPMANAPNSVVPLTVTLGAGVLPLSLHIGEGAELAGDVLTQDGRPIAGARVEAVLVPRVPNLTDSFAIFGAHVWRLDSAESLGFVDPTAHVESKSDAQGGYRILGLTPGDYRVDVFAPGFSYEQRLEVAVELEHPTHLEHRLSAAGVLQGNAPDITYLGATLAGAPKPAVLAILPDDGLFTLPGLAAGDYELGSFPSDASLQPIHLADVHVAAGRTTWIDLSNAGSVRVDGRLVDGHDQPVLGTVTVSGRRMKTGPDGAFTFQMFEQRDGSNYMPYAFVDVGGLQWRLEFPSPSSASQGVRNLRLGEHALMVTVLDPDGQPAAGTLEVNSDNLLPSRLRIGADGQTMLRYLYAGEHLLKAELPGAIVPPQIVNLPATQNLVLRALPCSAIEVRVVDANGRPAARIRAIAQCWQSPDPPPLDFDEFAKRAQYYETTTDYEGVAHILAPSGPVLVSALGWYVGDPTARRLVQTTRGTALTVELTVR